MTCRAVLRGWPARLAGALVTATVAATACGGSPGVPGPPSAYLGTVVDRPVPEVLMAEKIDIVLSP